ncbi:acireductone dioxygenase 1 isoform X2 [Oratosquilla oratoria]
MVQAWYMDSSSDDQRLEHHQNPPKYATLEELKDVGVLYFKLDPENYEAGIENMKKERGYGCSDVIEIDKKTLPNYDEKIKIFYTEHLHKDEEVRYCIKGSGYFDVRNKADEWVRISFLPGDLLIVPAGIYHRFTLDTKDYVKALRLFMEEPSWTPYNRPAENMEIRKQYLEKIEKKLFV